MVSFRPLSMVVPWIQDCDLSLQFGILWQRASAMDQWTGVFFVPSWSLWRPWKVMTKRRWCDNGLVIFFCSVRLSSCFLCVNEWYTVYYTLLYHMQHATYVMSHTIYINSSICCCFVPADFHSFQSRQKTRPTNHESPSPKWTLDLTFWGHQRCEQHRDTSRNLESLPMFTWFFRVKRWMAMAQITNFSR